MARYSAFDEAVAARGFTQAREQQQDVFDAFRAGKHIILKAPTGWGKTFAVTVGLGESHTIYSLPLRVLVNSLYEDSYEHLPFGVALQHGGRKEHRLLDKGEGKDKAGNPQAPIDLVFTTLDQTLSAHLGIPIGVRHGQGNTLPAVIDSSHLIFDEFHLFEPEKSMTTALQAIRLSRQNCIILTATLSSSMLAFLKEELAQPIQESNGSQTQFEVAVIEAKRPFVNLKHIKQGSGLEEVGDLPLGKRTLVICNQIKRAKAVALRLRKLHPDKHIHLLHSELLPKDRQRIESAIVQLFSKDALQNADTSHILVSTQVVEAGIDITSDVLHTDICPPASFVQRVGRSARYAGEEAVIYWHDLQNLKKDTYSSQIKLVEKLRTFLRKNEGEALTELLEHAIIELNSEADEQFIKGYLKNETVRNRTGLSKTRVGRDYIDYRNKIRDINSVNVAIGLPDDAQRKLEFLSISPTKLEHTVYKDIPRSYYRYDREQKAIIEVPQKASFDFALLAPSAVNYDGELGLIPGQPYTGNHFYKAGRQSFDQYGYHLEPYEAHINFLYEKKALYQWMLKEFAKLPLGKEALGIERANQLLDLVIWAHDLGKLDIQWQAAHHVARAGIPRYELPLKRFAHMDLLDMDYPIAHSQSDGYYQRKEGVKPPSHAWISAWVIKPYLEELFKGDKKLIYPILYCVAEHHGYLHTMDGNLDRSRFKPYRLGYLPYLRALTNRSPWNEFAEGFDYLNTSINEEEAFMAYHFFSTDYMSPKHHTDIYYYLSHLLRRCDQLATSEVSTTITNL